MANKNTHEQQLRQHPDTLVKKIVAELLKKKAFEVHFESEDDTDWSVVKIHDDNEDTEMGIRLVAQDQWHLQFGYYDDEDEFIELTQPLTQKEIDLIPKPLQKAMLKVLAGEEGLRLPGTFLTK